METLVVDTGALRAPELRSYLAASPKNKVALANSTLHECLQGDARVNVEASFRILASHPHQVVCLLDESTLAEKLGRQRREFNRRDLVNETLTRLFPVTLMAISSALGGDLKELQVLRRLEAEANRVRKLEREQCARHSEAYRLLSTGGKDSPLRRFANLRELSRDGMQAICNMVFDITRLHLDASAATKGYRPPVEWLASSYPFRMALCDFAKIVWWIRNGGGESAKIDTHVSDIRDRDVAVAGLYFDGIITKDKRLREVYALARAMLKTLLAAS